MGRPFAKNTRQNTRENTREKNSRIGSSDLAKNTIVEEGTPLSEETLCFFAAESAEQVNFVCG